MQLASGQFIISTLFAFLQGAWMRHSHAPSIRCAPIHTLSSRSAALTRTLCNEQAGAPITARESLRDSPDKKNPGEEGYGSLQGRATASYSPSTSRSVTLLHQITVTWYHDLHQLRPCKSRALSLMHVTLHEPAYLLLISKCTQHVYHQPPPPTALTKPRAVHKLQVSRY